MCRNPTWVPERHHPQEKNRSLTRRALFPPSGRFCGAVNPKYSKKGKVCWRDRKNKRRCGNPIDELDEACFYHSLCHEGNDKITESNCQCALEFCDMTSPSLLMGYDVCRSNRGSSYCRMADIESGYACDLGSYAGVCEYEGPNEVY